MGISGLLPLLKSIQTTKHLSEFSGQTIAVDAYVWLHRGAYGCAAELATGKTTRKYVDFAMHRVRLLRHHNIQPYIVFDGGPLPAKTGTENQREKRRQENLTRANALAAQGKHSQAREFYVKCLDVTPEMAYQLIKALKSESVPYIVAPYEADAQLAYLEQIGLVDGILTEDSDLLVFGCRNVLVKLDIVSTTVVSISKSDFASVVSTDGSGITLRGWSDKEFRTMAILSGCDYLPSIPGIGLKTAWQLLRKWKSVESVVRVIKLEGKKQIPNDYLDKFYMAERCFLHQRVYDPSSEQLVHLTDVDKEWSGESDKYVGRFLESSIAKQIAQGDIDPITLRPMRDIDPSYSPSSVKAKPLTFKNTNRNHHTKAKTSDKKTVTLIDFFGPKPIIPAANKAKTTISPPVTLPIISGKASGKRTLADVMDYDISTKKKTRVEHPIPAKTAQSRFFADSGVPVHPSPKLQRNRASSSRLTLEDDEHLFLSDEKENVCDFSDDFDTESSPRDDENFSKGLDEVEEWEDVPQVDGYLSPSPNISRWETPELSSPIRPEREYHQKEAETNDRVSSPPGSFSRTIAVDSPVKVTLVRSALPLRQNASAPNLREYYSDLSSDAELSESDTTPETPSGKPLLHAQRPTNSVSSTSDSLLQVTEDEATSRKRRDSVAKGWHRKWAHKETSAPLIGALRRRETTITPNERYKPIHTHTVPRLGLSRNVTPQTSAYKARHVLTPSHSNSDSERSSGKADVARMSNIVGQRRDRHS